VAREEDEYDRRARAAGVRVAKILEEEGAQAQALFERITKRLGLPTAKLLFERCIKLAKEPSIEEEQEQRADALDTAKDKHRARAKNELPTNEEIDAAFAAKDRKRMSTMWHRVPWGRKFSIKEKQIIDHLWRRYANLDGDTVDFNPDELTPTKKRGSTMRNSPNAELPRLYEEAKERHGQDLSPTAFARIHADQTGDTAENVRKKLDYHLKPKRKT